MHIEKLIESLSNPEVAHVLSAAQELAGLGEESQPAAIALIDACHSQDFEVRDWSVAALEQLGPPPTEAVHSLISRINDQEELADYWAITLLGRLGPSAAAAAECLGQALENSPYPGVCQRAAWALRELGPSAKPAQASLRKAAASSEPRLARLAQQALEHIEEG